MKNFPKLRVYDNNEMQLPEDILSAFEATGNLGVTVYLNAFHAGLMHSERITNPRRGLHFVCVQAKHDALIQAGFTRSVSDARVYTKIRSGNTLTLHNLALRENWMLHFATEREAFHCAAIYIDRVGRLFDPTHLAIEHINTATLAPLNDPAYLFENDIAHLFEALEFMVHGYVPTKALKIAIDYWHPEALNHQECQNHIYHYLVKQDQESAIATYAEQLQALGITEKLFNMLYFTDTTQLVSTLLQRLQIPRLDLRNPMNAKEGLMKSFSQLSREEPRLASWVNTAKNKHRESKTIDALTLAAPLRMTPK